MGTGKRKIEIKKKEKDSDRTVTFSKRKKGLFKKAGEFHSLTGSDVGILLFSPAGNPYTNGPLFDAALYSYLCIMGCGATTAGPDPSSCYQYHTDRCFRTWLNSVRVEGTENVEDLFQLKKKLEDVRDKVSKKVDEAFADSLIV